MRQREKRVVPVLIFAVAALVSATAPGMSSDGDAGQLTPEMAEKVFPAKPHYSPYAERNFPTRPFFGDTHLHTAMSFDAGMFGARLGPVDAYRFARGEEVTSSSS